MSSGNYHEMDYEMQKRAEFRDYCVDKWNKTKKAQLFKTKKAKLLEIFYDLEEKEFKDYLKFVEKLKSQKRK